ncbi:MAG TPA: hypothetical protein EYQ64_02280 [Gemmatimonadetes bacterium]|nr:hypothetical protein [Gemmatimonadota bacterium]
MHSVMAPEVQAMPHHWSKHLVEQWLIESGLAHTILQPASYMQNVRGVWPSIMDGLYPVPYPTDVPFSPVDLADVAEVAAEILSARISCSICSDTTRCMASWVNRKLSRSYWVRIPRPLPNTWRGQPSPSHISRTSPQNARAGPSDSYAF